MAFLEFLDGLANLRKIDFRLIAPDLYRYVMDSQLITNVVTVTPSEVINTVQSAGNLGIGDKSSVTYQISATGIGTNIKFGFFGSSDGGVTPYKNILGSTIVTWTSDQEDFFSWDNSEDGDLTNIEFRLLEINGGTPQVTITTSYTE